MKFATQVILYLLICFCVVVLGLSAYPGVLHDLLFFLVLFGTVPLLALGLLVAVVLLLRKTARRHMRVPARESGLLLAIVVCASTLIYFSVPRRIAFAWSRPSFDLLVSNAPHEEYPGRGKRLGQQLGIYDVDEYAKDSRGGVYFRVHTGPDGIGPDTMSYGFVRDPNSKGSPFGSAQYAVEHVSDNWYWFRASNDY